MQPRSLGKKKSQSKGVGESSSSSLIMKEGWVEGGERAQRRERKEIETLQRADSREARLFKERKVPPPHTGAG